MSLPLPKPDAIGVWGHTSPTSYTAEQMQAYGQACRAAALTDVVVLATSGASYLEIMDFLRRELEDLK